MKDIHPPYHQLFYHHRKVVFALNKVEQYIDKQNKIILEDKEKTLIALGLTEQEYSPNNKKSWEYPKYDYNNGEKRYYRDIAIKVTDEEYALILSKTMQVEEIKAKEEQARKAEQSRASFRMIKKWVPVFQKPKSEWSTPSEEEKIDNGRSRLASILRAFAWTLGILTSILGIVLAFETEDFSPVLIASGTGTIEILISYALAAILDYLAELTSIARNGYKYSETNK